MHGIIAFVDAERWTVTVEIYETGSIQYNVPIMSPYFCKEKGQGAYFIPETGAQCLVCYAYGQPFVLGFLPSIDSQSSGETSIDNLSLEAGKLQQQQNSTGVPTSLIPQAGVAMQAVQGTMGAANQATAAAQAYSAPPQPDPTSYRNNRDGDMLPGDYCLSTRARNRIKIFTNGNVLVEASKLCMRIYSKLMNWITDYCVNYTMNTPGGIISFTNDTISGATNYKREISLNVADELPAFVEEIGTDGAVAKRTVSQGAFVEQINADGSITLTGLTGACTIKMESSGITIQTTADVNITATGNAKVNASGSAEVTAAGSAKLQAGGVVTITGSQIVIG
jgi:hypothetical protein